MTIVNLSSLTPDYESIRAALAADLSTRSSWAGLIETQTGTTLLDWIASIGAFQQGAVLRAASDAFAETAMSERALYSIADMQGLRLSRKQPAVMTLRVAYTQAGGGPATLTIPAYTQLQGAGTFWYVWNAVSIPTGTTADIVVHQGFIVDQTTTGLGTDFQAFESVEKNFTVSNQHVAVFVDNSPIPVVTSEGLWNYKNAAGVVDRTTAEGRLHLLFGNATYGTVPGANSSIRIVYAVTSGADGNSVAALGQRISQVDNIVDGTTFTVLDTPSGGADQTSASTFRALSSTNFGTMGSAVTRQQFLAVALSYPGVVDAKLYAQRERDTLDVKQMNVVQVSVLTSSAWNNTAKDAFLAYLQERVLYTTHLLWKNTTPAPRTVNVQLSCYNWADIEQCRADATAAIQKLFSLRAGYLGYDITVSDLHRVVLASNKGIEYLNVIAPTSDLRASGSAPPPPTAAISTPGTVTNLLGSTSYTYALGVTDSFGVRIPSGAVSAYTTAPNQRVTLTWAAYPDAVSYQLYGRVADNMILLANLPSTTRTFVDNGTVSSTTIMPTTPVYPIMYNTLSSLMVSAVYSKRTVSY